VTKSSDFSPGIIYLFHTRRLTQREQHCSYHSNMIGVIGKTTNHNVFRAFQGDLQRPPIRYRGVRRRPASIGAPRPRFEIIESSGALSGSIFHHVRPSLAKLRPSVVRTSSLPSQNCHDFLQHSSNNWPRMLDLRISTELVDNLVEKKRLRIGYPDPSGGLLRFA